MTNNKIEGPLFYTLNVSNQTNIAQKLSFEANSTSAAILEKPDDYDVSIIRFSIPNINTPILTFKDDYFYMKMEYNGHITAAFPVVYINQNALVSVKSVWDIQNIIDMLNVTLTTCFNTLNGIITLPTSAIPYFIYDEKTCLISFNSDVRYYEASLTNPIKIYYNLPLLNILSGIGSYEVIQGGVSWYLMYPKNRIINVVSNILTIAQQAPTIDLYSSFKGLVFTTNLPIKNETTSYSYIGGNISQPFTIPILQDYLPTDLIVSTFYNNIVYNAVGSPYRQTSLVSSTHLTNMKIDVYYLDSSFNLNSITVAPNLSSSIKLMFTKKLQNKYA
jgi:hypothetical protein